MAYFRLGRERLHPPVDGREDRARSWSTAGTGAAAHACADPGGIGVGHGFLRAGGQKEQNQNGRKDEKAFHEDLIYRKGAKGKRGILNRRLRR